METVANVILTHMLKGRRLQEDDHDDHDDHGDEGHEDHELDEESKQQL